MYQQVYIEDMRTELLTKSIEIDRLRLLLAKSEKKLLDMGLDQEYLKAKINTYRKAHAE